MLLAFRSSSFKVDNSQRKSTPLFCRNEGTCIGPYRESQSSSHSSVSSRSRLSKAALPLSLLFNDFLKKRRRFSSSYTHHNSRSSSAGGADRQTYDEANAELMCGSNGDDLMGQGTCPSWPSPLNVRCFPSSAALDRSDRSDVGNGALGGYGGVEEEIGLPVELRMVPQCSNPRPAGGKYSNSNDQKIDNA